MTLTSITNTLLAAVKFFFDVAKLIPGLGNVLELEPVIVDGLQLGLVVEADAQALMATPEWAKFVASAKGWFEANGGTVTIAPDNQTVTAYVTPVHPTTPQEFNAWQAAHPVVTP